MSSFAVMLVGEMSKTQGLHDVKDSLEPPKAVLFRQVAQPILVDPLSPLLWSRTAIYTFGSFRKGLKHSRKEVLVLGSIYMRLLDMHKGGWLSPERH